jgi:ParB/RepB/Spo0J family partition protein
MENEVRIILLDELREPRELLRLVDKESVEYLELTDSIRENGVLNSILVRPAKDGRGYEIIDGIHRYTISKALGKETIPCIVKHGVTDDDVLVLQLQTQAIRREVSPIEYAKRLRKLLSQNPEMTIRDLARLIRKSQTWVSNTLELTKIRSELRPAIDRGEIGLTQAYDLSRLPKQWQVEFFDMAKTMSAPEFRTAARAAIKRYREAVQQGRLSALWTTPTKTTAFLRSLNEIVYEINSRRVGASVLATNDCQNIVDAFYAGLKWCVHQDKQSVQEQVDRIQSALEASDAVDTPLEEQEE